MFRHSKIPKKSNINFYNTSKKIKIQPPKVNYTPGVDMKTPLKNLNLEVKEQLTHFKDQHVQLSTLPNQLKIGTLDTNAKLGNITLVFKIGSRYELDSERGLSVLLNQLTNEQLTRSSDRIMYESEVDSETLTFNATFFREDMETALSVIAETIFSPKFTQLEIDEKLNSIKSNFEEQYYNPVFSNVQNDLLNEACFGNNNLGRKSLYCPEEVKEINLLKYIKKYINPTRCVIVGVNVDYNLFPKFVEKYFSDFKNSENEIFLNEKSEWIGGEKRLEYLEPPFEVMKQNIPPLTSVNLSFQGFSLNDKDIYAAHVLETLIGGGDSFSAGGPGKGLHSIIHSRYLCQFDFYSMKCEHKPYTDNGIFQISASTRHDIGYKLIHPIAHLYQSMFEDITIEEIQSAKNRFKSMILSVLEDIHGLSTNLAYDLLYLNHIRSGYFLCQHVDDVTIDDLKRVREKFLNSKPALSVIGNISQVENYDKIEKFIGHLRNTIN